jgi:hypothetical protein
VKLPAGTSGAVLLEVVVVPDPEVEVVPVALEVEVVPVAELVPVLVELVPGTVGYAVPVGNCP